MRFCVRSDAILHTIPAGQKEIESPDATAENRIELVIKEVAIQTTNTYKVWTQTDE